MDLNLSLLETIPQKRGSYLLILSLSESHRIQVGRLGEFDFTRGFYGYAGSAFGAGGLRGRLRHHIFPPDSAHWHIDHLRKVSDLVEIYYWEYSEPVECKIIQAIISNSHAQTEWAGFGSTDCKNHCSAHLIKLGDSGNFEEMDRNLDERLPGKRENVSLKSPDWRGLEISVRIRALMELGGSG